MVHGMQVDPGKRAGAYMSKYLHKTFERPWLTRRFSTSRGWPGGGRMRLLATVERRWDYIRRWPPDRFRKNDDLNPREEDLLVRVGEDIVRSLELRNRKRKATREHGQMIRRYSVRPKRGTDIAAGDTG